MKNKRCINEISFPVERNKISFFTIYKLYFFHLQKVLFLHWSTNSRANRGGSVVNCSIYRQLNTHTIINKQKQKQSQKKGWESVIFPTRKALFLFFSFLPFSLFHFFFFAFLSFTRLIICQSNFILLCLFGRHRRSHHAGEACLIMPRAIWF